MDKDQCSDGMHSWVNDPTFTEGTCSLCGEDYGLSSEKPTLDGEVEVNEANVTGYGRKSVVLYEHHHAHVARLQAEVERLTTLHDVDTEAMRRMLARNAELEGLMRDLDAKWNAHDGRPGFNALMNTEVPAALAEGGSKKS